MAGALVTADLRGFTSEELRAACTRALADCCDECRAILREQLEREEFETEGQR